jgi:anti-sigma factor RsiW
MGTIGDQLQDNREPTLLLYLLDELSPADRAEVKRLLEMDPSLQNDLDNLRLLHADVMGQLENLDTNAPLLTAADQSTRKVMREMRKHQLELNSRTPVRLESSSVREMPRWIYPVAAAAAIVFIFLGLWGVGVIDFGPGATGTGREIVDNSYTDYPYPDVTPQQERLEDILFASFGNGEEIDHPLELEESEDPATIIGSDASL